MTQAIKTLTNAFIGLGLSWGAVSCCPAAAGAEPGNGAGASPRALVVYFSCTDNTRRLAERIAEAAGAAVWRIEPTEPYMPADLDYEVADSRANREQNDPAARPAIKGHCDAVAAADIIFIGYPIWWGEAPRVISTFLARHDLSGKTIVPFCTSGSSPLGESDTHLHHLAPQAHWKPGRRFGGHESRDAIRQWFKALSLPLTGGSADRRAECGAVPTVLLNQGSAMPVLGLGTYSLRGEAGVVAMREALDAGYRKFDTAHIYENERETGRAIRESGLPREEMFVATKIYPNQYGDPAAAIEQSLRELDLGYIDLMLLHHPGEGDVRAYRTIESYIAAGTIRAVGLSNYYEDTLRDFLPRVDSTPALVQNEIHPYYQDTRNVEAIRSRGIAVEAWYPLGGRGHTAAMLSDANIKRIAQAHGKSPAQVILRWHLQRGVVPVPGSASPQHLRDNLDVFDFALTEADMQQIAALNRDEKHDWY